MTLEPKYMLLHKTLHRCWPQTVCLSYTLCCTLHTCVRINMHSEINTSVVESTFIHSCTVVFPSYAPFYFYITTFQKEILYCLIRQICFFIDYIIWFITIYLIIHCYRWKCLVVQINSSLTSCNFKMQLIR